MGKRKLSRQQARRIENLQRERAGRVASGAAEGGDGALGPEREGLIVAHHGSQVEIEAAPGETHRCHLRANLEGLVTGDRVVWRQGEPTGVVVAALQRGSELSRPDAGGRLRPVAANIDRIVVVIAPEPEPHANLLDRYLVAAEAVDIEPVIVLNKVDLLRENAALSARMNALLAPYPALGYRVLRTSIVHGDLAALAETLRGHTSVIVGQSGVGKSSLVNALVPRADVAVGSLSEGARKGTHTTTTARLLHLPGGGSLIDSPGIREFGLWHMSRGQLERGFREFRPFLGHCRFRDCKHENEPGCALLVAVESGAIDQRRMESYRHIVAESARD